MARNEGTNIICWLRAATTGILDINVNFNVSYRHDLHERNYFNYKYLN